MRMTILLAALALSACGGSDGTDPAGEALPAGQWSDGARSGLCVAEGGRAAFILYADEGDANCMAEGEIADGADGLLFVPRGDTQCRIPLRRDGERIVFGTGGASCDYYCGDGVATEGRSVARSDATSGALNDPAGDSIC